MVTNHGFTAGAKAVAESQKIALLVVTPKVDVSDCVASGDSESAFRAIQARLRETPEAYDICVEHKFASDPNDGGADVIKRLLANPVMRRAVTDVLSRPDVKQAAERIIRDNPDIARNAMDFFKGRGF